MSAEPMTREEREKFRDAIIRGTFPKGAHTSDPVIRLLDTADHYENELRNYLDFDADKAMRRIAALEEALGNIQFAYRYGPDGRVTGVTIDQQNAPDAFAAWLVNSPAEPREGGAQ